MKFPKLLTIGLLSLSAIAVSALPTMARPGSIYSGANLRAQPSVESQRIDSLPEGTPLEILQVIPARNSNARTWYYIRSTGNLRSEGWVSANLITVEPSDEIYGNLTGTAGDVINIRSAPNLESRVIHTGVRGDLVQVGESYLQAGYRWYNVTYPNGASGWVRGDLINVWPQGCIITCPEY
jgi:uncharacterized protein YgiM (DUF1202 family)